MELFNAQEMLISALGNGYNYMTTFMLAAIILLVVGLLPVLAGSMLGWRKPPAWYVIVLVLVSGSFFSVSYSIALKAPKVHETYYDDLFKKAYLGNPDDTTNNCPVYIANEDGMFKLVPLLDENNKPVMRGKQDDVGRPIKDADGNVIMEPVVTKVKVEYELFARPFGPEKGFRRIYFLLGSPGLYREPHLCALEKDKPNLDFMKKVQKTWDGVHGTEPEAAEQEGQGSEGSEGPQGSPQEGPQGHQQGPEGPMSPGKPSKKSPITITFPDQEQQSQQQSGRGTSQAEQGHAKKMREGTAELKSPDNREGLRGTGDENVENDGHLGGSSRNGLPSKEQ